MSVSQRKGAQVVELPDHIPINLICLAVLGVLGLRKLIRMEGLHWLRVAILTGLLWVLAIYLILLAAFGPQPDLDCVSSDELRCAYAIAEI